MDIIYKLRKLLLLKLVTRRILPDKIYYKYSYLVFFGSVLSYKNPVGFNAKLQWLKVFYRNKKIVQLADKFNVREYVADVIGKEYLVPLIGVYENTNEINWEKLPNKFVLKATHGSGWNVICKNKQKLDKKKAQNNLNNWLKSNYYILEKEWQYKTIKPRIIAEQFLEENSNQLFEIKLFCYQGKPEFIVCYESQSKYRNIYNKQWKRVNCETTFKQGPDIPKPKNLDLIFELASKLSENFPFLRVDFFLLNNKIYFGELTFTPSRGLYRFKPKTYDLIFGEPLHLPIV